jgi:hypothetical protein
MRGEDDSVDGLEPVEDAGDNGLGVETLPAVVGETARVPAFIAAGGERAGFAFIDFFTAQIRNRNTRAAYALAVRTFCSWCDARQLTLKTLRTHHVVAYVELLGKRYSAPTVKQHLAAIRMLFDWLVVRQVVDMNPAAAVRGPKHVVKRGKTPVLEADEARTLLESIDVSTLVGLRDRALIALLIYTFARVSAAIGMNVEDYYVQGRRSWVRLHEKGGKRHAMPAHHLLETYMDEISPRPLSPRTRPLPYSAPPSAKPAGSRIGACGLPRATRCITHDASPARRSSCAQNWTRWPKARATPASRICSRGRSPTASRPQSA